MRHFIGPTIALPLTLCAVVLSGCGNAGADGHGGQFDTEFHNPPGAADDRPFSDAVRADDLLFLSGKIGLVPGTRELDPGGIEGETRRVMDAIKASVERYGSNMDNVVKCTVFLADIAEWAAMNSVYVTYFPDNRPARSAMGVSGLALGARVEIECIAALPDD